MKTLNILKNFRFFLFRFRVLGVRMKKTYRKCSIIGCNCVARYIYPKVSNGAYCFSHRIKGVREVKLK